MQEIYWELTTKCNNKCAHCFLKHERTLLVKPKVQEILDWVLTAKPTRVRLGGGEPQLIEKDLFNVAKKISSNNIPFQLITGIFPKKEIPGTSFIQVTVDEHHLKDNKEILILAKETKISNPNSQLRAVVTVADSTINKLDTYLELCKSARFDVAIFCRILPDKIAKKAGYCLSNKNHKIFVKWFVNNYSTTGIKIVPDCSMMPYLKNIIQKKGGTPPEFNGCPAGKHTITIKSNGDIIPCWFLREDILGNVSNMSPKVAFKTKSFSKENNPPFYDGCYWANKIYGKKEDPLKKIIKEFEI